MIAEQLKASILQAAIEGKLTEQLPSDGQVDEILKLFSKKDKKWKPINDDEIPFKIPDSWKWLRLREFSEITAGGTPSRSEPKYWNGDIPWIKIGDMKTKFINSAAESITTIGLNNSSAKIVPSGTILFSIFASIGTVGILNINAATNQAIVAIKINENIYKEFIYYVLIALKNLLVRKGRGMAQININQEILKNTLIPIPPFEEQKRIVNKIEELLPKLESLQDDETKLMDLVTNFPEQLKTSILRAAIEGKLTEQLPSDGSAIELIKEIEKEKIQLLKQGKRKKSNHVDSIFQDEIPFEIPKNWVWVKLSDLIVLSNGTKTFNRRLALLDAKYLRGKKGPEFIDYGEKVNYDDTVILVDGENSGEVFLIKEEGYLGSTFKKLDFYSNKIKNYILLFIKLKQKILRDTKKGAAIPHLNKQIFYNLLVPLPPLEEQKRIVNKIEELLTKISYLGNINKHTDS